MTDDHTWTKTIWIPKLADSEIELTPDEKGLTKELAVVNRAIDDGNGNRPAGKDTRLNQTQLQICGRIFEGILLLNEFLADQLDRAVQAARGQKIQLDDPDRVRAVISREIDRVFHAHRPDLEALRLEELRTERDLRAFRARNRLFQGANYRETVILPVALIILMLVGESILNGALLAEVMTQGLLGGALLAALISFINITLGVSAGLVGWRYLGHYKRPLKVAGGMVAAVCHVSALLWNLLVAHFREAAELLSSREDFTFELNQLTQATIDHVSVNGLLGIASLPAWALLLLGLIIHFLAAKEGWDDFADRYPDYKKHDVKAKAAARAFDDAIVELRDEAREAIESIEQSARDNIRRSELAHRRVLEIMDVARQRRQEVLNSEDDWVVTGNRLLKLYRDQNVEVRDPGSAPAYFDVYPSADDYRARNFGAGLQRSGEVETQHTVVERYLNELAALESETRALAVQADEVAEVVHHHATRCIKSIESRLTTAEEQATNEALRRLPRDDDEMGAASTRSVPVTGEADEILA